VCHAALAQRAVPAGGTTRSHAARRVGTSRLLDARDPHLLARRRRGRGIEQVARQAVGGAAPPRRALHAGPPGRGEHRGQREQASSSTSAGCTRHQQREVTAEPQDPAGGGEQRHVHVVEHEHLVAQHREPVEVLGPLVVLDVATEACSRRRAIRGRW
jgi:hypothetical protein